MSVSFISIVLPCHNEEKYIKSCLDSIIEQDYPKDKIEVLCIDGISTDRTREIINDFSREYKYIRLIENTQKYVPFALNAGIKCSSGEIIFRMDAHSIYPINYISLLTKRIAQSEAVNIGCALRTLPAKNTNICKAIAIASSNMFGVGNAWFRIGAKNLREVDTVPFGCFKRELFESIGYFDTDLIRNQDDEFNARIIKNGGKILLVPDLTIDYYAREDLKKMARMFYQYGYYKPLVNKKIGSPATVRQLIPPLFFVGLIFGSVLSLFSVYFLYTYIATLLLYFSLSLVVSTRQSAKEHRPLLTLLLPLVFILIHISYGAGFIAGMFKFQFADLIKSLFGKN